MYAYIGFDTGLFSEPRHRVNENARARSGARDHRRRGAGDSIVHS
jgi:hypothetical protein